MRGMHGATTSKEAGYTLSELPLSEDSHFPFLSSVDGGGYETQATDLVRR